MSYQWYSFSTDEIKHVSGCRYTVRTISVLAWSLETARRLIGARVPASSRVIAYWEGEGGDITCNMCGGPFSFPTGNFEPEKGRCWCGVCAQDMAQFLKAQLNRRVYDGMKFYAHAFPPPDIDTSSALDVTVTLTQAFSPLTDFTQKGI